MRRCAVLLVPIACVACSLSSAPPPPPPGGAARAAVADPWANPKPPPPSPITPAEPNGLPYLEVPNPPAAPAPPARVALGPAPRPPAPHVIVAPPSQEMRALAVMPDGSAAVSADVGGSVRLWPSLGGTQEPVVVQMRRPVALAVTRGGSGADVAIAGIDGAGQLELVVTGALGEPRSRTRIELARPAVAVHATRTGFLVERDDQHLTFVASSGQVLGDVEPPPGTHVAAIAVRDNVMLALLAGGGAVHGRWLVVEGQLRWGAETGALPIAPRAIALAPNHTSIAAIEDTAKSTRLVVVGLEHGDKLAGALDNDFVDPTAEPIGFLDATTVLVHFQGMTSLWHTEGGISEVSEDRRSRLAAVAGSQVVSGNGADLMLTDAAGTVRYLGFRIGTLNMFAPGARTLLASDGQRLVRLGSDLRDHASFDLPQPQDTSYNVMTLLNANHVLVQRYSHETYFEVVEIDTLEVSTLPAYERFVAYDPATRIAAFVTNDKVLFRRFDGKAGAFGDAAELEGANISGVTFAGDHAIVTGYREDGTYSEQIVTRIRPEAHALKVVRTARHPLQLTGDEGATVIPPSTEPFARTAKSPDGALVATLSAGRMTLRDAGGTARWTVLATGATDLAWLGSGELLATGAGIARVDLETGAYTERHCGWQFGLWSERIDNFASAEMCEAE